MISTVDERFERTLEAAVRAYAGPSTIGDLLAYHFGYAPHVARRGKRLRPKLLLAVAHAEGGAVEASLDAAAAIEILHNYSLVHDDIEDRDEMRHGRETLWKKYGLAQALNAGDAMCALSLLSLTRSQAFHSGDGVVRMVEALHGAHLRMCHGQSLDLQFESEAHVNVDRYSTMIAGKTAALFSAACELGALSAECDEATVEAYRSLGVAYGLAFQIADDVDGVWGRSAATGKREAVDIARRKWSFPVVWALSHAKGESRSLLERRYALGRELQSDEVDSVVAALEAAGAREAAQRAVAEHLEVVRAHPRESVREFLLDSLESLVA